MKILPLLILTTVLTMTGMPVLAQQTSGPTAGALSPESGPGGPPSEERREEVRKKIEAVRIWRLTEDLKLDTSTSAKLSSLLSSLDQKRHDTMRAQMKTIRELRALLKTAKPDDAAIKALLEKLEKNHREIQALKDQELKGVKELLTIEQQAGFLLFQHDFQHEMRGMIHAARGKNRGKGEMGPRGQISDGPEEDRQSSPPGRGQ